MPDMNTLYLDYQSFDHAALLYEMIQREQAGDPLYPVTVVGPSTYANISLRQRVAKDRGMSNVRFMVLSRVAELIGAPYLASQGRSPLTGVLESAAIRVAAKMDADADAKSDSGSSSLAALASHPSTHQVLKQSFRQLRHASDDALRKLREQDVRGIGLSSQVLNLYRGFSRLSQDYYDAEDLAYAAAESVRGGLISETALDDLGYIVFFHVRDISPAEREMIEALSESGRRCDVVLAITGEPAADAPLESLAQRLSASFGDAIRSDMPSTAERDMRLLIAPDPHQEIRSVISRIMRRAEEGMPFHRMAVLYGTSDPYASLIREELEIAGISVAGPATSYLSDTAVGRTLIGLIGLSDGKFMRDSVMSWLTGCPVRPPEEVREQFEARFSPSRWDSISRKARIVQGAEQWKSNLGRFADGEERRAEEGLEQEEISEGRANAMRADADCARDLLLFFERLESDVKPPSNGSSWGVFCSWASRLLDKYLDGVSALHDAELAALETVKKHLDEMKLADAIDKNPGFDTFRQALNESLQRPVGHIGRTGEGVFVASIGASAGMNFDMTHIAGMIEGAVPPAIREDPLISDRDRQAVGGSEAGLPTQQSRRADERHNFLSALASAPRISMSFPMADPVGGRGQYASRWFLEQASALSGSPVYTSTLTTLPEDTAWLDRIHSMESVLADYGDTGIASAPDAHEYDLQRLWRWKRAGRDIMGHPLVVKGEGDDLARSFALQRGRYGPALTEWDGDLSGMQARFVGQLGGSSLSPTSLERWATCPFSYFLGYILRLGSVEKPEDIYSMRPLDRGALIHKILEEFILEVREDDAIPAPTEAWTAAHRDIMHRIAEREFRESEDSGGKGRSLLWQLDKEAILNDLGSFMERDSSQRRQFGVSPAHVEARFGLGGDSWPGAKFASENGPEIEFRGMIDRVDISPDGTRALVLDYKAGGATRYENLKDDPIDGGRRLQLAVYSLAAREALGESVAVEAAYWFVTSRGGLAMIPQGRVDMASDETRARFDEGISTIVSGIGRGLFPANSGDTGWKGFENCGYCDFDSLCPSRRNVLWNKKSNDPRLQDYLRLSDGTNSGKNENDTNDTTDTGDGGDV